MGDTYYKIVRALGRPAFWASSRPTVLHADRIDRPGPMLIAPNHLSPYDVAVLIAATPQLLDFVSIVEVFRNPLSAWFLGNMNAFPLDRGRVDPATTRKIVDRLERGRKVVMFPEGQIRRPDQSLLNGGTFKPSVARLAQIAQAPIIPTVVLATGAFARHTAWLPLRRTKYAVAFGEPIQIPSGGHEQQASATALDEMKRAYHALYSELSKASGLTVFDSPWR
jgi:1-acyl-sn-glycerol-3-phosphate acyltransferase